MKGQWISIYDGLGSIAWITIDIDERRTFYEGAVSVFRGRNEPLIELYFRTNSKDLKQTVVAAVNAYHWGNPAVLSEGQKREWKPEWTWPQNAELTFERVDEGLKVSWQAPGYANGDHPILIEPSKSAANSEMKPVESVRDWTAYKQLVAGLDDRRFFFRGQGRNTWRLRSAFHRSGRYNANRHFVEDIPNAHAALLPLLTKQFNLKDDLDHASFLHLLQHHGYPTPLLDWSLSPFVAAYFAFSGRRADPEDETPVRIHIFDPREWQAEHGQFPGITQVGPGICVVSPRSIENPRSRPQQSVSTASNIDDLEAYVTMREAQSGRAFLKVVDLPYHERRAVLRDLRMMGLTAETLFPGLAGACEALAIEHIELDASI